MGPAPTLDRAVVPSLKHLLVRSALSKTLVNQCLRMCMLGTLGLAWVSTPAFLIVVVELLWDCHQPADVACLPDPLAQEASDHFSTEECLR